MMTMHSAKGLEFPVVFLVGLEANHFPGVNRRDPLPFPARQLLRGMIPAPRQPDPIEGVRSQRAPLGLQRARPDVADDDRRRRHRVHRF